MAAVGALPNMADARPCALCGGGDEEGLMLKCATKEKSLKLASTATDS